MDKKEIEQLLRDYHWMIRVLINKAKEMDDDIGQNLTAKYGIDAFLPKGKGRPSDPVYFEFIRRYIEWQEDVGDIEQKVLFIQELIGCITDKKEKVVLNMILDGDSLRDISKKLGMSLTTVRAVRDSIVDKLYKKSKSANGAKSANCANSSMLKKEKSMC